MIGYRATLNRLFAATCCTLSLVFFAPLASAVNINTYELTGTCAIGCDAVGASNGDAVSATIAPGFVDLNIGASPNPTGDVLDTSDPLGSNFNLFTASLSSGSIGTMEIRDNGSANRFFYNSATGWDLSLSSAPINQTGTGTWTSLTYNGVTFWQLVGTCSTNCSFIGLSAGDAISALISFGFTEISIGTKGDLLDSLDPLGDGISIGNAANGTMFTDLRVNDSGSANVLYTPTASGFAWGLSPSSPTCNPAGPTAPGGCLEQSFAEGNWSHQAASVRELALDNPNGTPGVPVPATFALFVIGLAGLATTRRRNA